MKVTTVIVTYNAENLIDDCLLSVLNSSYKSEVIVLDNCSTDRTINIIKTKYPSVHLVENKSNLGFGKANNIGIKLASESKSDFVLLLNQDAFLEKDTLEKLVQAGSTHEEYGIISPVHLNGDKTALDSLFSKHYIIEDACPGFVSDSYLNKLRLLYDSKFVNAAAWLISKKCIDAVGGFNPYFFMYGEDVEYCNRLKYHRFKIGIRSDATVAHLRIHSNNKLTKSKNKYLLQRKYFLGYRIALTNINMKFIKTLFFFMIDVFKRVLKSCMTLNFVNAYFYFEGGLEVVFKLGTIIKNRKLTKENRQTFLSNS